MQCAGVAKVWVFQMTKAPLEKFYNPRKCIQLNDNSILTPLDIFSVEGVVVSFYPSTFYSMAQLDTWQGVIVCNEEEVRIGERVKFFGFIRQNWTPDFRIENKFESALHSIKAIKLS